MYKEQEIEILKKSSESLKNIETIFGFLSLLSEMENNIKISEDYRQCALQIHHEILNIKKDIQ